MDEKVHQPGFQNPLNGGGIGYVEFITTWRGDFPCGIGKFGDDRGSKSSATARDDELFHWNSVCRFPTVPQGPRTPGKAVNNLGMDGGKFFEPPKKRFHSEVMQVVTQLVISVELPWFRWGTGVLEGCSHY